MASRFFFDSERSKGPLLIINRFTHKTYNALFDLNSSWPSTGSIFWSVGWILGLEKRQVRHQYLRPWGFHNLPAFVRLVLRVLYPSTLTRGRTKCRIHFGIQPIIVCLLSVYMNWTHWKADIAQICSCFGSCALAKKTGGEPVTWSLLGLWRRGRRKVRWPPRSSSQNDFPMGV